MPSDPCKWPLPSGGLAWAGLVIGMGLLLGGCQPLGLEALKRTGEPPLARPAAPAHQAAVHEYRGAYALFIETVDDRRVRLAGRHYILLEPGRHALGLRLVRGITSLACAIAEFEARAGIDYGPALVEATPDGDGLRLVLMDLESGEVVAEGRCGN